MCISCFSRIDAIGLQSIAVLAAAGSAIRRVRSLRRGETAAARRATGWDESAAFLRSMGHEPAVLLGPRPEELTPPEERLPLSSPQAREPMLV